MVASKARVIDKRPIDEVLRTLPIENQHYVKGIIDGFLLSSKPTIPPAKEERICQYRYSS